MSPRRVTAAGLVLLAAAGGGLAVAGPGEAKRKPKAKVVEVGDNYYSPAKLTIKPGTKVTWKWPADVGDTHDVKTKSVPKGAKKFASPPYATAAKWSQTFKKAGTYKLYCTFHLDMTMKVVVKK